MLGCLAFRRNQRDVAATRLGLLAWRVMLVIGALLAVLSLFVEYSLDARHHIFGFPFMAAAWEERRGRWQGFAGPLTLPAYVANAVFAFLLPQVLLRLRARKGDA